MNQVIQTAGVIFLTMVGLGTLSLIAVWIYDAWTAIMNYPKAKCLATELAETRRVSNERLSKILRLEREIEALKRLQQEENYEGLL